MNRIYQALKLAEIWVVAAAVLAGMIWTPALISAPLIGLAYILLQLGVEERLPGPTPADLPIFLLALLLSANYAFAAIPEQAVQPILRIWGAIVLYYAVVHWCRTTLRLRWMAALTGLAALALSFFSVISVTWTSGKLFFIPVSVYERFSVLVTDAVHPNVLAGSLIAILPLALAVPQFSWRKSSQAERLFYPLVFFVASAGLVLTQSRGALLALFVALLVVFILRSRWFWSLPLSGILALTILWFTVGQAELKLLITDLISIEGLGQRTDIWQRTIYMIQDFPLTGVGMGHYSDVFRIFYPMSLDPTSYMPHAHNLFLQVGADLGIPGLILWLSVLLAAFIAAWQVYRAGKKSNNSMITAIGAGLLGCQLAIIFHGMFDSVLWGLIRIAPLVWWIWGLSMATLNIVKNPNVLIKIDHDQNTLNQSEVLT